MRSREPTVEILQYSQQTMSDLYISQQFYCKFVMLLFGISYDNKFFEKNLEYDSAQIRKPRCTIKPVPQKTRNFTIELVIIANLFEEMGNLSENDTALCIIL